MILDWNSFINEKVEIRKLKRAIKKQEKFSEIDIELKEGGRSLKDIIKSVAEKLEIFGNIKAYKSGMYGITFTAGDKTLKITTDNDEALMVKRIMDLQSKLDLDHIIKYHDILKLKIKGFSNRNKNYYVIIMDRVLPLESDEIDKKILDFVVEIIVDNFDHIIGPKIKDIQVDNYVQELLKSKIIDKYPRKYITYLYDMGEIVKQYNKLKLPNYDIHDGNIGMRPDGTLVSFDPTGVSKSKSKIKKLKI